MKKPKLFIAALIAALTLSGCDLLGLPTMKDVLDMITGNTERIDETDDGDDDPPAPIYYTVNFHTSQGTISGSATQSIESGKTVTFPSATANGYTLLGWSKNSSATAKEYDVGATYTVTSNVDFYAVWKSNIIDVTSISLNKNSLTLIVGEQETLIASVLPSNASNKTITWASSAQYVATVSQGGLVTAKSAGTSVVTATAKDGSGVYATATITVQKEAATLVSVSISGQQTDYTVGDAFVKPTVTAHYSDGATANVTSEAQFTGFSSSTTGNKIITVSYTEGSITKTTSYSIVVSQGGTIITGDQYQIKFKTNTDDNNTGLTSATFREQISSGSEFISSISSLDKVYAGKEGIKFGSSSSGGYINLSVSSSISNNEATSITVNASQYGSVTSGTLNIYINNSSKEVISVNPSISESETCQLPAGTKISSLKISSVKRCYLKGITISTTPLVPVDPTSISVSPSSLDMSLNETSNLSISYLPENANQNKSITWTSSNSSVATVSNNGTVTALAKGNAVITATSAKGLTSTCNVTVKDIAVSSISISPTSYEISKGSTKQLSAIISPSNATNQGITWTSSKTSVATVDTNGLVTAVAVGTATISATSKADSTKKATCDITVTEQTKDAWTILMYICGADLESESGLASGDIEEILSVSGQPKDVNIVIQTGGASSWSRYYNYGISSSANQRYHVENNDLICDNSKVYSNYKSMGLSSTLADFVGWGMKEYPADKTGIIFWNHGGGMRGVCYDEKKDDDSLLNSEIKSGITSGFSKAGLPSDTKLEFVGFDACLMQVQDIADYASSYANYMVASEESESGYGWDYDNWVDDLYAKKSTDTILKAICDSFIAENGGVSSNKNDQTLSYLNLAYAQEYKTAWENMTTALTTKLGSTSSSTFISWVGKNVKHYADTDYNYYHLFDAKDFINKLSSSSYNPGSTYTNAVLTAHSKLVTYSTCGKGAGNSNGLCMVFVYTQDQRYEQFDDYYTTTETDFSKWRTFNTIYGNL